VNPIKNLRDAKATTLRRVRLARSCAMKVTDVVGEGKGVDELGVRVAYRGRGAEGTGYNLCVLQEVVEVVVQVVEV